MQLGGIAVTTPHLNTEDEDNVSRLLTEDVVDHTISQNAEYKANKEKVSGIKSSIKTGRTEAGNTDLSRNIENMSKDKKKANDILQQPGCTNWLNINYNLNKQQFLDAVRLTYQLPIPDLTIRCHCG